MEIDIRTLVVVLAMTLVLSTLVLVVLGRLNAGVPGPRAWTAGMMLVAVAQCLIFLRDFVPTFLSIGIANGILIAGMAVLAAGFLRFTDRPVPVRGLTLYVAVFWLPFLILYHDAGALPFRIVVSDMGLVLLALGIVWTLLWKAPPRAAARRITGALYGLYALALAARSVVVVLNPPGVAGLMQSNTATAILYLCIIALVIASTAGMAVMVSERLRDELQARIKDLDAARRSAETALGEQRNFLAMVSHEFRTPLGIMSASAEVIACNLAPDDRESAEEVARIRRASIRLANLVEGCLADEWLESASETRRSERVDLGAVLSSLAAEHGIALRTETPEPVLLDGDPYLLPIAFSCLVDNARKYGRTLDGVQIRMVTADAATVTVEVRDDGPGVNALEAPRLFEKFYRSPHSLHKPGAGLGLYLVRRIVALHNGAIDLDQARGTAFRVTLPLAPSEVA